MFDLKGLRVLYEHHTDHPRWLQWSYQTIDLPHLQASFLHYPGRLSSPPGCALLSRVQSHLACGASKQPGSHCPTRTEGTQSRTSRLFITTPPSSASSPVRLPAPRTL